MTGASAAVTGAFGGDASANANANADTNTNANANANANEYAWLGDLGNEQYKDGKTYTDLATQKGWKDPSGAVREYANMEKILGEKSNAVVIPTDKSSDADWEAFLGRLRPADKAAYKIEGLGNDGLQDKSVEWFYKAGITPKQAQMLASDFKAFLDESSAMDDTTFGENSRKDMEALKTSWGKDFDDNMVLVAQGASYAAKNFGITAENAGAVERAIGTKNLLTMLQTYGKLTGEATLPTDGNNSDDNVTDPKTAIAKINQLKGDPEWRAKVAGGKLSTTEVKMWENLHKIAYPEVKQ